MKHPANFRLVKIVTLCAVVGVIAAISGAAEPMAPILVRSSGKHSDQIISVITMDLADHLHGGADAAPLVAQMFSKIYAKPPQAVTKMD